jgi:hypothetical protein
MTRLLHILGIHDWVPRYVIRGMPLNKDRMVRLGSVCTVCGRER